MDNQLKTVGAVALVGAAIGTGLAVGAGLRVFLTVGAVALTAGAVIGVASGLNSRRRISHSGGRLTALS